MKKKKHKMRILWYGLAICLMTGVAYSEGLCIEKTGTVGLEEKGELMAMTTDKGFGSTTASDHEEISRFLADTFPGDDRVLTEDYSKSMQDVARQYPMVKEKMREKYPSYDLEIIRCEPKSLLGPAYNVFFVTQDKENDPVGSAVYVYEKKEDDTYALEIKDAFIGVIMQPVYSRLLLQKLQRTIPECFAVNTQMSDVYADDYDENLTPEEVMAGKYPMWNRTRIIADGRGVDENLLLKEIKDFLRHNTFCGSYQILITDGNDDADQIIAKDTLILPLTRDTQE